MQEMDAEMVDLMNMAYIFCKTLFADFVKIQACSINTFGKGSSCEKQEIL